MPRASANREIAAVIAVNSDVLSNSGTVLELLVAEVDKALEELVEEDERTF